jgi:hypothetical protein
MLEVGLTEKSDTMEKRWTEGTCQEHGKEDLWILAEVRGRRWRG